MSAETKIEWATSTGNPWIGCTKVSPGCKNCYAATLDANRFSRTMGGGTKEKPVSHWGPGAPRFRTKGFWRDALKWNREAGNYLRCGECGWEGWHNGICPCPAPSCCEVPEIQARPRIFPSLCDWLDEEVPIEWLADFLSLVLRRTPNLDWLLLTKRPELFRERLLACIANTHCDPLDTNDIIGSWLDGNAPRNVWVGTSVENQPYADIRIAQLAKIPAALRFLSVEPLLGPVKLNIPVLRQATQAVDPKFGVDWIIVGGESGTDCRPCHVDWIRDIVDQCETNCIPLFVKQLGGFCITDEATPDAWPPGTVLSIDDKRPEYAKVNLKDRKGGDMTEWPDDLRVREFPTLT